jgi:serine/threonine-protein kinase HipA
MFRYSPAWLEDPASFPIEPGMRLSEARFFASGSGADRRSALAGVFSDGAPDAWGRGLIRRALPGRLTEFDYLLAVNDEARQGAIRYLDEQGSPLAPPEPVFTLRNLPRLRDLAGARELSGPDRWVLVRTAGSLGGARPKASLRDRDDWLLVAKFTTRQDTRPIERVEVATLGLARSVGINASTARVGLPESETPVALIRRFDRTAAGRIHYLSAQSFLGLQAGTPAFYTDIADALRAHAEGPLRQLGELYRRIVFSILVANCDDHLRNHGLLHSGRGRWRLAPAFDINPEPQRQRHLETGISELSRNEASLDAAIEAAPFFEVDRDRAAQEIRGMATTIRREWRERLADSGLSDEEIRSYEPAFENEEARSALRIRQR